MSTEQKPACARCTFSEVQQLPPPNLGKILVCKRFPPTPLVRPAGNQIALAGAAHPVVNPDTWCHEFSVRFVPPVSPPEAA